MSTISSLDRGVSVNSVGVLELDPYLVALATRQGEQAAREKRLGQIPTPCPYDANGASLTQRRMAGVWARAYAAATPEPNPLPA